MKLGGWTRLGLVFSAIWAVIVITVIAVEFAVATPNAAGPFVDYVLNRVPDAGGVTHYVLAIKYPLAVTVLIAPLVALWLGTTLLVFVYRWVRRGFQRDP